MSICQFTWQKEIKVADRIKFANQITINQLDYPGGSNVIVDVFKSERRNQKVGIKKMSAGERLNLTLLALQIEEGVVSGGK